jgi:hypothetical protein
MSLMLKFREVARKNIEDFDRLGGFHGAYACLYHYGDPNDPNDLGCAIGICDPDHLFDNNMGSVDLLVDYGVLVADDLTRFILIQVMHDYVALRREISFKRFFSICAVGCVPPDYLNDLLDKVTCWADMTPEIYKECMRRIADEPVELEK